MKRLITASTIIFSFIIIVSFSFNDNGPKNNTSNLLTIDSKKMDGNNISTWWEIMEASIVSLQQEMPALNGRKVQESRKLCRKRNVFSVC